MFDIHRHAYVAEALASDRRRRFELEARNSRLARLARRARKSDPAATEAPLPAPRVAPPDNQPGYQAA